MAEVRAEMVANVWKVVASQGDAVAEGDTIVILDKLGHFAGAVPIARILLAASEQHMSGLKTDPLVSISSDANEKDVFELFDKYNLRMLTVLDNDRRPIGVITVDDVVSRLVNA